MRPWITSFAKVYAALLVAALAVVLQQSITWITALRNIIPMGLAERSVGMRDGKILLDGERTISWFDLPVGGIGIIYGSLAGMVVILLGGLSLKGRLWDTFAMRAFRAKTFLVWLLATILFVALYSFMERFIEIRSAEMESMLMVSLQRPLIGVIGIGIAVPIFEEMLFRGWLYGRIDSLWGPTVAIISTSILFTLVHMQYSASTLLVLFVFSLILGMSRYRSGSIWVPIILHCMNNTTGALLVYGGIN
jgi:membrane protease YdiL (CAAX protease family)